MQSQLTRFPIIKPFVKAINQDVGKFGLQGAMSNAVTRSGTNLIVKGLTTEVRDILKNKATVVVSNHPHEVDIVALFAALPKREDVSLIISSRFMNLAPKTHKYLIPVYIEHHTDKSQSDQLIETFFKKFHPVKTYSPEEEHKKNIESIKKASEKVSKGGLVVIFPSPSKITGNKWYTGVGYLLKGTHRKKPTYVVKAHIEGTSNMDYLRLLPYAARVLTPIHVTFDQPMEVSRLLKQDPKEITSHLEKKYNSWSKSLK